MTADAAVGRMFTCLHETLRWAAGPAEHSWESAPCGEGCARSKNRTAHRWPQLTLPLPVGGLCPMREVDVTWKQDSLRHYGTNTVLPRTSPPHSSPIAFPELICVARMLGGVCSGAGRRPSCSRSAIHRPDQPSEPLQGIHRMTADELIAIRTRRRHTERQGLIRRSALQGIHPPYRPGPGAPKLACAVAVGVAALIFMRSTNVLGSILVAVHYLGIFLIAWVGVALSHVLGAGRKRVAREETAPPDFQWAGLFSWLAGVLLGIALGFVGGAWDTLAAPATLLVSALIYRVVHTPTTAG